VWISWVIWKVLARFLEINKNIARYLLDFRLAALRPAFADAAAAALSP
jgi:hypothetical protein